MSSSRTRRRNRRGRLTLRLSSPRRPPTGTKELHMADYSVLDRFRLDGKTAIVTGIGPGIGSHVARGFAQAGANVVLAARGREKVEALAAQITSEGGVALAVPTDVGIKDE